MVRLGERIGKIYICEMLGVTSIEDKLRENKLRLFGHLQIYNEHQ